MSSLNGSFQERRGKKEPANKTCQTDVEAVKAHIKSFPHYVSHYCRKQNQDVKYLPQNLNLSLMYPMYKNDYGSKAVSESMYRKIFPTDFNLKFQHPKKDTCTKCDMYKNQISALMSEGQEKSGIQTNIEQLKESRDKHQMLQKLLERL